MIREYSNLPAPELNDDSQRREVPGGYSVAWDYYERTGQGVLVMTPMYGPEGDVVGNPVVTSGPMSLRFEKPVTKFRFTQAGPFMYLPGTLNIRVGSDLRDDPGIIDDRVHPSNAPPAVLVAREVTKLYDSGVLPRTVPMDVSFDVSRYEQTFLYLESTYQPDNATVSLEAYDSYGEWLPRDMLGHIISPDTPTVIPRFDEYFPMGSLFATIGDSVAMGTLGYQLSQGYQRHAVLNTPRVPGIRLTVAAESSIPDETYRLRVIVKMGD